MPMLKNPRHERFAQLVARGKPMSRAYVAAGYRPDRANARRLTTFDHVRRRITAIRKEHERMSKRTKEQHFAKWLEREDKVEKQGKDALAHKISYDYAMAMGWITTKQEVTTKQDNTKENAVRLARLSPDERLTWERLCAKISEDLTEEELAEVA
jgi:hypothetical protein